MAADAFDNPRRFVLRPGKRADITQAEVLIGTDHPEAVVVDKGYDANALLELIEALGAEAAIPPKKN